MASFPHAVLPCGVLYTNDPDADLASLDIVFKRVTVDDADAIVNRYRAASSRRLAPRPLERQRLPRMSWPLEYASAPILAPGSAPAGRGSASGFWLTLWLDTTSG